MRPNGFLLVGLLGGVAGITGCSRDGSPAGQAGLPPAGKVRIIPTRIQEDAKHFTWVWTIMGDRNWTKASASGNELKLSSSYPLNSKETTGGTHIWEATVSIEPAPKPGGSTPYVLQLKLRGSNAAMDATSAALDLGADSSLTNAVRAVQSAETTLSLPTVVTLASVGRRKITLKIEP